MPIVVRRNEFKSHTLIDVCHFWLPRGESKLAPSDKGVIIPAEQVDMFITVLLDGGRPSSPPLNQNRSTSTARPQSTEKSNRKTGLLSKSVSKNNWPFLSDPDYVAASTGKRFANLEV